MDGERRLIDGHIPFDDLPGLIDQNQVGNADVGEVDAEGVDPEALGVFRIARRNVPGNPFTESEFGEKPEGGGEALLAMQTLFRRGGECRQGRGGRYLDLRCGRCGHHD